MKLKRYKNNPIIKPNKKNWWESEAVFNCAVFFRDGIFHMLYRAAGEYEKYISRIGYATSRDGFNFKRISSKPLFDPKNEYEKWGCEDPRLVQLEGKIYMTYVVPKTSALTTTFSFTALASTPNFQSFRRYGIITSTSVNDKDVVLFPERINGEYIMLHRPMIGKTRHSIWISYSKNLKKWYFEKLLMEPAEWWESKKIGSGPPPLKTKKGWLLIYHGVDENHVYRAGAALLKLNHPTKVIGRLKEPILEPEERYEKVGYTPNVVFPEGAVIVDDILYVYYGGADKVCCVATCKVNDILSELKSPKTSSFN